MPTVVGQIVKGASIPIGIVEMVTVGATDWRVFYSAATGEVIELALGASGTVLKSNGASAAPTWVARTESGVFYIENPVAGNDYVLKGPPLGSTLTYASYTTDKTNGVVFNVEKRANASPRSAGTNIWTVDKTATIADSNVAAFDSGTIAARDRLVCAITSVASAPTVFDLYLEWTVN